MHKRPERRAPEILPEFDPGADRGEMGQDFLRALRKTQPAWPILCFRPSTSSRGVAGKERNANVNSRTRIGNSNPVVLC